MILAILAGIALVAAGVLAANDRRRPPAAVAGVEAPAAERPVAHA